MQKYYIGRWMSTLAIETIFGAHNMELSRPADLRAASTVHSDLTLTDRRHLRGRLQRFVMPVLHF